MGEVDEGLGSAIEGALMAHAVETKAGEGPAEWGGACLNCGTTLIGPHCHWCGQKSQVHRTFSAILHDLVHGVLHLDGKLWRTLPLLAFKPGELTRRYIDGERAKFVSPMAMFLFSVFLMFAVFQSVGLTTPSDIPGPSTVMDNIEDARANAQREVVRLEGELAATDKSAAAARRQLEWDLADARETLEGIEAVENFGNSENVNVNMDATGIEAIDNGLLKKWRENPGLMLYKLQSNAYKFSWLLIPLSIPFVWLMFAWNRKFRVYDHAIFVTYSIAFISLLFISFSLIGATRVMGDWIYVAIAVIPTIHIYKDLRGTYNLSRFSAGWRLLLLLQFILIVVVLFLQILLLMGAG